MLRFVAIIHQITSVHKHSTCVDYVLLVVVIIFGLFTAILSKGVSCGNSRTREFVAQLSSDKQLFEISIPSSITNLAISAKLVFLLVIFIGASPFFAFYCIVPLKSTVY